MIRKFILTNSQGQSINLNDLDTFVHSPSNLGVSLSNSFYNVGSNFLLNSSTINQNQITFRLVVNDDDSKYNKFRELMNFLNFIPYTLTYEMEGGTYLRDCILNTLSKSEIGQWNVFEEDFILDCTTSWYRNIVLSSDDVLSYEESTKVYVNNDTVLNGGFYIYDYHYGNDVAGDEKFFNISNNSLYMGSSNGSPLEIFINGNSINPSWQLFSRSIVIQSDGYFLTLNQNQTLAVSSFPQNQQAVIIGTDGLTTNVYQQQDLTKSNFITIPIGNYTLRFQNVKDSRVSIRMREELVVV